MTINSEVTDILNDLIQINNDRLKRYESTTVDVSTQMNLAPILAKNTTAIRKFIDQLKDVVKQTGNEPAEGGTASGNLYQMWTDLIENKDVTAPSDLVRADRATVQAYDRALGKGCHPLPNHLRVMLNQQRTALKMNCDEMQALATGENLAQKHTLHPVSREKQHTQ